MFNNTLIFMILTLIISIIAGIILFHISSHREYKNLYNEKHYILFN